MATGSGWLFAALLCAAEVHAAEGECTEAPLPAAPDARALEALEPAPLGDEDLPWCTSADDARCAPLPGHGSSGPELGRNAFGTGGTLVLAREHVEESKASQTAVLGLRRADGTRPQLERPPQ